MTMDPTIRSSRLLPAALALYDRLAGLDWPVHPTTARPVPVSLLRDTGDAELVVVLPGDDNDSFSEWTRGGPAGRDEQIVIPVMIRVSVKLEQDPVSVVERLQALHVAAASVTFDFDAMKPAALGFDNEYPDGFVRNMTVTTAQSEDRISAEARLEFALRAKI